MKTDFKALALLSVLSAGVFLSSVLYSSTTPNDGLSRGAMLSASCEGCHGTNGRSPGAIPAINGKSADFIQEAMESFRSGERQSTVMVRHVKGYSDEEIRLIAEYFARQQ